ncbi:MAG: hypothetical protein H6R39_299, partial [Deltaproteobacteria bacterium]|nr:hypothetical protein [Deltaproteobacteria bacterium]
MGVTPHPFIFIRLFFLLNTFHYNLREIKHFHGFALLFILN